jgi:hypothetical protein
MSGSTTGDHRAIETVAKALATAGAYDRFAYQEEVWQRAQALMENETVWGAVVELAGWLRDLWAEIDAPEDKGGHSARQCPARKCERSFVGPEWFGQRWIRFHESLVLESRIRDRELTPLGGWMAAFPMKIGWMTFSGCRSCRSRSIPTSPLSISVRGEPSARAMSAPNRRAMVERPGNDLSVRRQGVLLSLTRSGVHRSKPVAGADDLAVMRRIDELHLEPPFLPPD